MDLSLDKAVAEARGYDVARGKCGTFFLKVGDCLATRMPNFSSDMNACVGLLEELSVAGVNIWFDPTAEVWYGGNKEFTTKSRTLAKTVCLTYMEWLKHENI